MTRTLSWLPDLSKRDGPLYQALADQLANDIASGRLAIGTRLPPQRALAWELGCTHGTVTRAYERAEKMGLVNAVVPHDQLDAEVEKWCAEILEKSPTAISIAKKSFNLDSESIRGISTMGMQALKLYYETEESREGVNAFNEKRKPDFRSKMT